MSTRGLTLILDSDPSTYFGPPNSLIKQTLESLDLLSMLEPRGLYRTDGKRPDGLTMYPWEMGKQLVWDVTVVDALAPSRLNGSRTFRQKKSRDDSANFFMLKRPVLSWFCFWFSTNWLGPV